MNNMECIKQKCIDISQYINYNQQHILLTLSYIMCTISGYSVIKSLFDGIYTLTFISIPTFLIFFNKIRINYYHHVISKQMISIEMCSFGLISLIIIALNLFHMTQKEILFTSIALGFCYNSEYFKTIFNKPYILIEKSDDILFNNKYGVRLSLNNYYDNKLSINLMIDNNNVLIPSLCNKYKEHKITYDGDHPIIIIKVPQIDNKYKFWKHIYNNEVLNNKINEIIKDIKDANDDMVVICIPMREYFIYRTMCITCYLEEDLIPRIYIFNNIADCWNYNKCIECNWMICSNLCNLSNRCICKKLCRNCSNNKVILDHHYDLFIKD